MKCLNRSASCPQPMRISASALAVSAESLIQLKR